MKPNETTKVSPIERDGTPKNLLRTITVNPAEVFALMDFNAMASRELRIKASHLRSRLPKLKEAGDEAKYIETDKGADDLEAMAERRDERTRELAALYPDEAVHPEEGGEGDPSNE